jgi:hypothetical protein
MLLELFDGDRAIPAMRLLDLSVQLVRLFRSRNCIGELAI